MPLRLAVFIALSTVLSLSAQTSSTAVVGTVLDPSGAVISGAKVTLLQTETDINRNEVTSDTGDYNFPLVNPGLYSVTVSAPGFKVATRSGVQVDLDQKARVDFHMEVGSANQTVEVTAQGALLSTDQATLGQVLNQQKVVELPLNGRNIGALASLQPGVQNG